jgi:hypothetical protein
MNSRGSRSHSSVRHAFPSRPARAHDVPTPGLLTNPAKHDRRNAERPGAWNMGGPPIHGCRGMDQHPRKLRHPRFGLEGGRSLDVLWSGSSAEEGADVVGRELSPPAGLPFRGRARLPPTPVPPALLPADTSRPPLPGGGRRRPGGPPLPAPRRRARPRPRT